MNTDHRFIQTVKFIRQLYGKTEGLIPLHEPVFYGNEKKYLLDCIDRNIVSGYGKYVKLFEGKIIEITGVQHAVSIINGTSALHLALILAGVKSGDEVVTQSLSYIATPNAISYCGARPVFLDIDPDTLGLSPQRLDQFLKKETKARRYNKQVQIINTRTRKPISAIIPVHIFGHTCRIDEIVNIANKYDLPVIEDAAECIGSFYKNRHCGTYGTIGILSFNGNKTITTGGGGMILTDNEQIALKSKHLSQHARINIKWHFDYSEVGYNYRMPDILAAIGLAQAEQLPKFVKNKRIIAEKYLKFFEGIGIKFFTEPKDCISNYWLNSIILKNVKERDELVEYANKNEIMVRPVWPLMSDLTFYSDCYKGDLTDSEYFQKRIANLPSSYNISII